MKTFPMGNLTRPIDGRLLGGVCAGLSDRFGMDVMLVRLAFLTLSLASGIGVGVYALIWLLSPTRGEDAPPWQGFAALAAANGRDIRSALSVAGNRFGQIWRNQDLRRWPRPLGRRWLAILMVGVGLTFLLWGAGLLSWLGWRTVFGLLLVIGGSTILLSGTKDRR